jgi:hypothetical protein
VDAPLPQNPMSAGWMTFVGILIAGATLKEVVGRLAKSPVAIAPKRPSMGTVMVVGLLLKSAAGRIGHDAMGLPARR